MKPAMVVLLLGTIAFGQETPTKSSESSQSQTIQHVKRGNRVFFFTDGAVSIRPNDAAPFQAKRYQPTRRGERVFFFEGSTGTFRPNSAAPFQGKRYLPPRRGERVFFFKDNTGKETTAPKEVDPK